MAVDASIPAAFGNIGIRLPDPVQQFSTLQALKAQAGQMEALKAERQKQATLADLATKAVDMNTGELNPVTVNQMLAVDPSGQSVNALVKVRDGMFPQFNNVTMSPTKVENYRDPTSGNIGTLLVTPGGKDRFIPQEVETSEQKAARAAAEDERKRKQKLADDAAKSERDAAQAAQRDESKSQKELAAKARDGIGTMQAGFDVLDTYERLLEQKGPVMLDPELDAAYTALTLELKNVAQLGALAGPDLGLLQGMVTPPTSVKGKVFGKDGLMKQLRLIRERMTRARNRLEALQRPGDVSGTTTPNAPVAPKGQAAPTKGKTTLTPEDIQRVLRGGK